MRICKIETPEKASVAAATLIARYVLCKKDAVLGLATGSTPLGVYGELIRMYKEGILDFSTVRTFNLDEYADMPASSKDSYAYYMFENLFNHININRDNIHLLNGMAEDARQECKDFETTIADNGGIDIMLLGIGHNGHIGFNEPGGSLYPYTHVGILSESTKNANQRNFDAGQTVPDRSLTMGIASILKCREIVLLALGEGKAEAIERMVKGPMNPMMPASFLHAHQNVTIIVDKEAGSRI